MTKKDLEKFIEREGSSALAPLLLQAMERIEMVASMDRFDSFEVSAEIINCRLLLTLFKETLESPIEIEAAEDGKSVKMEVKKEPISDKDESAGMVVPDKAKMLALLESTSKVIDAAIAAKKNSEKVATDGRAALANIEKVVNEIADTDNEKKVAARISMNTMTSIIPMS